MLRLILYAKSISFRPPYRSLGFRSDGVPSVQLVLTFVGQTRQLMLGLPLTGEAEYWPSRCSLWFHPREVMQTAEEAAFARMPLERDSPKTPSLATPSTAA
jgi:hypothetical protein